MDDQPPRGYVAPPPIGPQGAPPTPAAEEVRPPPSAPAQPDELPPIGSTPPPHRSRLGGLLWLIILVVVVVAVVWYVLHRQQPTTAGRAISGGPMPVGTTTVQKGDMPITVAALGTVTPLAMVTVRTQLNGQLVEVGFQEGQMVNKGDFLAQIDPRPYQVALEQAEGQLAKGHGCDGASSPLPTAATTTARCAIAYRTAAASTGEYVSSEARLGSRRPPRLRLITRAPLSTAQ